MTLLELLTEGTGKLQDAGSPDAGLDAQQLLFAAFHLDMVHYLLDRMRELPEHGENQTAVTDYREMVRRRSLRCPLQQILGTQEFMGMEFCINEHVLIPRQDTEALVELVLEEQKDTEKSVLDLCTGTGCIAISLCVKGGYRNVTATDISPEALEVAGRNAKRLLQKDTRICLLQGDLWDALNSPAAGSVPKRYDIITSNPPYIPTAVIGTLEPEVRDHEPILALDGTEDGLHFYRRIIAEAKHYLHEDGMLYLEIGYDQGPAVRRLLEDTGYREIRVCKDLTGNDRVVCARN